VLTAWELENRRDCFFSRCSPGVVRQSHVIAMPRGVAIVKSGRPAVGYHWGVRGKVRANRISTRLWPMLPMIVGYYTLTLTNSEDRERLSEN
jgi:hypothetical protein